MIARYPFAPGWSGAKSYGGFAQFPHDVTWIRTYIVSVGERLIHLATAPLVRCELTECPQNEPIMR